MPSKNALKAQKKRAEKLLKAGKLPQAGQAFYELCQADPGDAQTWFTFASIASQLNHHKDAVSAYSRALHLNPNLAEANFGLASSLTALEQYHEAEKNFRSFLLMQPNSGKGYYAYAQLLQRWGRITEATEKYQKAAELIHDSAELCVSLSAILRLQGMFDEALTPLEQARQLQPKDPNIYLALATLYRDTQHTEQALAHYEEALKLAPQHEAVYQYYLGTVYEGEGDEKQALIHYDNAISLKPDLAEAHVNKALCLLLTEQYIEGWAEYEWRKKHPDWLKQRNHQVQGIPAWRGDSLPEKSVLVVTEQGYGDCFQFCRFLTPLSQQFAKVTVRCKPEVAALLESVTGIHEVISISDEVDTTQFDVHVHMMSLPHLLGITLENLPNTAPYLHAPAILTGQLQELMGTEGVKVGLAWSGSPANPKNYIRKISLAELAPLADIPNLRFFGLQKGPGSEQALTPPPNMTFTDLADELHDFSHTAAAIENLDLIISVDSAIAHLAGALGKPVWTLLYSPPDWRYLMHREDSPWYPSMRIFRQNEEKSWAPVVQQVASALRSIINT